MLPAVWEGMEFSLPFVGGDPSDKEPGIMMGPAYLTGERSSWPRSSHHSFLAHTQPEAEGPLGWDSDPQHQLEQIPSFLRSLAASPVKSIWQPQAAYLKGCEDQIQ